MPVNVKTKNTEQNAHMCSALHTESPLYESTYREYLVSHFCNPRAPHSHEVFRKEIKVDTRYAKCSYIHGFSNLPYIL